MYKLATPNVKTIRQGDIDFSFQADMFTMYPRATMEISESCPTQYKQIIRECIYNGWLQSVAHMKDSEYMWETLQK